MTATWAQRHLTSPPGPLLGALLKTLLQTPHFRPAPCAPQTHPHPPPRATHQPASGKANSRDCQCPRSSGGCPWQQPPVNEPDVPRRRSGSRGAMWACSDLDTFPKEGTEAIPGAVATIMAPHEGLSQGAIRPSSWSLMYWLKSKSNAFDCAQREYRAR